ncbi:MAG: type IV pilus biogenesis/stability protein PilW [Gammaproteobacteria bacterium]|nr:type IV pilus biogenesis/stability protein PilW [Gammaproteobacteria bacterium]
MNVLLRTLLVIWIGFFIVSCTITTAQDNAMANKQHAVANINVQLGLAYLEKGSMARAKQKLLLALQQHPHSWRAHSAMAYLLERSGDTNAAATHYQQAIKFASVQQQGATENNYGAFLCRQKRYQQGDSYLLKAATNVHYIHSAHAYENAGLCALLIPNDHKAVNYFTRAVQQDSALSLSWWHLALLHYQLANYPAAGNALRHYLQRHKTTSQALWLGVRIGKKRGDSTRIKYYATMLRQQFPAFWRAHNVEKM